MSKSAKFEESCQFVVYYIIQTSNHNLETNTKVYFKINLFFLTKFECMKKRFVQIMT